MTTLPIIVLGGFAMAIIAPFLTRRLRQPEAILTLLPSISFVYFLSLIEPVSKGQTLKVAYPWCSELGLKLSFHVDGLSLLFSLLITGIGVLVLVYSRGYFGRHHQLGRFYGCLLLFMASMLGLVTADNVLTIFIFWELTSLSSYFLIGFSYEKASARSAAKEALLITSGGGLAMLGGLIIMGLAGGSFELSELANRGEVLRCHSLYLPMLLLLLVGAFTKSAQVPFHFWLPKAMEAPTPVSAYLHSATMVKAGIYMLARLNPTIGGTKEWELLVTIVGAITMVVGACMALVSVDLKQLLAYLTVSALGIMTMLLGIGSAGAITACMVFLLAHAFYKGALFMIAGAVDHATGTRDIQQLGGLRNTMPITAIGAVCAAVSLAAFFPVLSFISKEMLFEAVLHWEPGWFVLLPATVLTAAIYVAGALLVTIKPFFGRARTKAKHGEQGTLWIGPLLLSFAGIAAGVFPMLVQNPIIRPSVQAILGEAFTLKLALWHGFNTPLLLSVASFLVGGALYLNWQRIRSLVARSCRLSAWGPQRWYGLTAHLIKRIAETQTHVFQRGHLRLYVLAIIVVATALIAAPLLAETQKWPDGLTDLRFWEAGLALIVVFGAGMTIYLTSRLAVIASLSAVGFGVALIFLLFGAPDVSMTQFLAETLLLILLIVAFFRLPRFAVFSSRMVRARDFCVAVLFGCTMSLLVLSAIDTPHSKSLSQFYAEKSVPEAKGRNLVNVILVDFRALDTLGEITVLATAAMGVFALLKLRLRKEEQ